MVTTFSLLMIVRTVLILLLLWSGVVTLFGSVSVGIFHALQATPWLKIVLGIVQIGAALFLIYPGTIWLGAVLTILLLLYAWHLYVTQETNNFLLSLTIIMFLAAGFTLWEAKADIPFLNSDNATQQKVIYDGDRNFSDRQKPSPDKLKEILTPLQYHVTQEKGTEPPFANPYWNNKQEGIYVDIVSGEPLFSSTHKYRSGTGRPSFWRPIETGAVVEKSDNSLGMNRTEIISKHASSHIGHVFNDGPEDKTGLRYCMNSAAMQFIPKEEMATKGYEDYLSLFEE